MERGFCVQSSERSAEEVGYAKSGPGFLDRRYGFLLTFLRSGDHPGPWFQSMQCALPFLRRFRSQDTFALPAWQAGG